MVASTALHVGWWKKKLPLEGCILILATWNGFPFSNVIFDIEAFRSTLAELSDDFAALAGYTIHAVDLESHRARVESILTALRR